MRTIYSDDHRLHKAAGELSGGEFIPSFEKPERADAIRARIETVGLGPITPPDRFPREKILRVHDAGMVSFLEAGYEAWRDAGRKGDAVPGSWFGQGMRGDRVPGSVEGKLCRYTFDASVPLTATTWQAVRSAVDVALTGADTVWGGAHAAFALCRPPGHHASTGQYGGYCYLNNAAIAAQHLLDHGARRIAILDIDYHHGNGTQEIFAARSDVLFASIHGDPDYEYPFLSGYADETGTGPGEGFTLNLPLPSGSDWSTWGKALDTACDRVAAYGPDMLIVSLGVDTYRKDPISEFRLDHDDYLRTGERIARLGLPTIFVMEGGYAVAEIAINTVNVLQGFLA